MRRRRRQFPTGQNFQYIQAEEFSREGKKIKKKYFGVVKRTYMVWKRLFTGVIIGSARVSCDKSISIKH